MNIETLTQDLLNWNDFYYRQCQILALVKVAKDCDRPEDEAKLRHLLDELDTFIVAHFRDTGTRM